MKIKELEKIYPYNHEKSKFIVDVQLEDYRDAYSGWDFSPYTNRDLDEDLIEYLLECSYEITLKYGVIMKFHILDQLYSSEREERSLLGMVNFFQYQIRKLNNQKMRVIRDIVLFLIIGAVLLLFGFYVKNYFTESIMLSVLSEGLFIGGWVMLWEMFSAWLFEMKKVNQKIKHFKRLADSEILYTYETES